MSNKYLGHSGGLIGPDKDRSPWPLLGYAPGNYSNRCAECKKEMSGVDELCFQCLECAVRCANEIMAKQTPAAPREDVKEGVKANKIDDFWQVLEENYVKHQMDQQAQIAGYYNDDKTHEERKVRQAVITEYEDLIAIYKEYQKLPPTPTYPAEFVEWVFENCILLEGSWYTRKIGEKKFTLAELFAGPYQTGQNNRGIIMVTDPLDNSVNMITAGSPEPMHIVSGVDDTRAKVLADVNAERNRQNSIWGQQNHTPYEWLAILGEEFGEVCKAVFEARHNGSSLDNYREELVQVAAVAVQMIECYDRNKITNP